MQTTWLDRKGLAAHLKLSLRTIDNLRRRRVLPYVKIGRTVRFDLQACREALQKFEVKSIL